MRVRIDEQDDRRVRYTVIADNGKEVEQKGVLIAPLKEKARKAHKSLEFVLAQEVGAEVIENAAPVINVRMVEPKVVSNEATVTVSGEPEVAALTLADLEARFAVKDHPHETEEYAPLGHQHMLGDVTLGDVLRSLKKQIDAIEAMINPALLALERKIDHHDHDVPMHPHPSLVAQIEALREAVSGLESRPVGIQSLAGYVTEQRLQNDLSAVQASLQQMNGMILAESQLRQQSIAAIPIPQMDVYGRVKSSLDESEVEAIVLRILESRPKGQFRELSRQRVGDHVRLTVEEV